MDSLITAAARALAAGDPLGARGRLPSPVVAPQDLEEEPRAGVEGKEGGEHLAVVALAGLHEEEARRGDRERRGRLVDLGRVDGVAPRRHRAEDVRLELLLARGAVRRERQRPGEIALGAEAA